MTTASNETQDKLYEIVVQQILNSDDLAGIGEGYKRQAKLLFRDLVTLHAIRALRDAQPEVNKYTMNTIRSKECMRILSRLVETKLAQYEGMVEIVFRDLETRVYEEAKGHFDNVGG